MIKVTLLFGACVVLSTAAILKSSEDTPILVGCKSESEFWASVDGTKFCVCIGDNKYVEQSCPQNTFFVRNATVSGCIRLIDVSDNCVSHVGKPVCDVDNLTHPHPHEDPQKFYLCPEAGAEPVPLSCSEGAFAHEDGFSGCYKWPQWRDIRGCPLYE